MRVGRRIVNDSRNIELGKVIKKNYILNIYNFSIEVKTIYISEQNDARLAIEAHLMNQEKL